MKKVNVVKPYVPNSDVFMNFVHDILACQNFTNNGVLVQSLEAKLKELFNVEDVILVSNGTIALQLLYKAMGLTGNVITTPFSFLATASSLMWENLNPVFSDIDMETFNLCPSLLSEEDIVSSSAILPVHVFGQPCDVDAYDKIASEYEIDVIYDAAHAFNVKQNGKSILGRGRASTLSFHATKIFQSIEGGAIITNDTELASDLRELRSFGEIEVNGKKVYGINAKMSEFHAAMGLAQLEVYEDSIHRRRKVFNYYKSNLKDNYIFQKLDSNIEWNYSYAPILFKDESLLQGSLKLLNDNNINPRRYFYPSLDKKIKSKIVCKNSENISSRILCLPLYADISDDSVEKIVSILKK